MDYGLLISLFFVGDLRSLIHQDNANQIPSGEDGEAEEKIYNEDNDETIISALSLEVNGLCSYNWKEQAADDFFLCRNTIKKLPPLT